jgi:short-subunit dehydrogenase
VQHVILVGATDGVGLALAKLYLGRQWSVALLGRDPEKLLRVRSGLSTSYGDAKLFTHSCDITDVDAVAPAFDAAAADLGGVDLVIYCAGAMTANETTTSHFPSDRAVADVNFVGAMHVLGTAANYFQAKGRGHIAAIGSIAGERGRKAHPAYCASKAALHTYLEGLRNRFHAHGVRVSTIKPGFIKTRMLPDHDALGAIEPDAAAVTIARGLDRGREVFFVPHWWAIVALALRWCPRFIFKRFGPA